MKARLAWGLFVIAACSSGGGSDATSAKLCEAFSAGSTPDEIAREAASLGLSADSTGERFAGSDFLRVQDLVAYGVSGESFVIFERGEATYCYFYPEDPRSGLPALAEALGVSEEMFTDSGVYLGDTWIQGFPDKGYAIWQDDSRAVLAD